MMTPHQFLNLNSHHMFLQDVTWHRLVGEEVHVPETAVLGAEQARQLGTAERWARRVLRHQMCRR